LPLVDIGLDAAALVEDVATPVDEDKTTLADDAALVLVRELADEAGLVLVMLEDGVNENTEALVQLP
ncbi:MAG: hypothetical protein M1830_006144, partial [Pleopsidium flavum]